MPTRFSKIIALALTAIIATATSAQQTFVSPTAPTQWRQMGKTTTEGPESSAAPHSDYAFANTIVVDDGPSKKDSGQSDILPDGTWTWSIAYTSEGALSMSATLTNIEMPDEGAIVVTDGDGAHIETITNATIARQEYVGTEIAQGDKIIIRYIGPEHPTPQFDICEIHCGTRPLPDLRTRESEQNGNRAAYGQYGASKSCEIPAICTDSHDGARRATCRLIINGSYLGSGTLINNTSFDGRPLVLTSAHVIHKLPFKTCKALFCFEEPVCDSDGTYDRGADNISGGTLLCYNERADVALIELPEAPSVASRAYYAGWNRSTEAPVGNAYCFHHPGGDVKKMGIASLVTEGTYNGGITENTSVAFYSDFHWRVLNWELGLTEAGSSGSSLIDANGLVIGALTGGNSNCTTHSDDYYWRLCKAWNIVDTQEYPITLAEILDPNKTGTPKCHGMEIPTAQGEAQHLSSIDDNGAYEPSDHRLSMTEPSMTQQIVIPDVEMGHDVYIHAVSVMVATGTAYDTKPQIVVGVNDANGMPLGETSEPLASFAKDNVVQINFAPAIRVPAGNCQIELSLKAKGFTEAAEGFSPYETITKSEWQGEQKWGSKPNADRALMMHIDYSTSQPEQLSSQESSSANKIWFEQSGIEVSIGQSEGTVEVFARNGHRVMAEKVGSRASLSTSNLTPGLYIIRLTTAEGENHAKILIY